MASEGWRLVRAGARRKLFGYHRYQGTAIEICEQIVRRCFDRDKRIFLTSVSSYPEIYARDFGRCVPALLSLGFESEVGDTFRYALDTYERAGSFALTITPSGRLLDFPAYAPDGFALFVFGLAHLADSALVARYRSLLERETLRFADLVVEPASGLVRRRALFSEAQDYAIRDASCYSSCVCYLLQRSLDELYLPNPLAAYDYRSRILETYWAGDHFLDDQRRPTHPSGDAQVLPFWTGLMGTGAGARARLDRVLQWMDGVGLNLPLPVRYGIARHSRERRMNLLHLLNPWQGDAVWTCLGLQLLEVLRDFDHPRFPIELRRYRAMVERLGCFPEVLDAKTGDFFAGPIIASEDSMLWAANLWHLLVAENANDVRGKPEETDHDDVP